MYDEPTAGLDPVASTVVEDLIRELHEQHGSGRHTQHGAHAHPQQAGQHSSSGSGNGAGAAATMAAAPPAAAAAVEGEPGGITSYIVVTHQHSTIRRAGECAPGPGRAGHWAGCLGGQVWLLGGACALRCLWAPALPQPAMLPRAAA